VFALVPSDLVRPTAWYRLATFALVQGSIRHLVWVAGILLASGWLAERWLDRRTMWIVAAAASVISGMCYTLLDPTGPPAIGGGFIAAGFAGAAVATSTMRRNAVTRGGKLTCLVLLLLYGLTPLRPDPQSLAMLAAFIAAGGFAAWRLRSRGDTTSTREHAV
jgi:membrane associated rhomboid family serine protease